MGRGLMTVIRAYAKTKEQECALKDHGVAPRDIYLEGRGAETLEACLATFRGRPGALITAHDLRLLGCTKRAVSSMMDRLELARIKVQDISHPNDQTHAAMIQRANVAISASRFQGDRPKARQVGRAGGRGKGRSAAETRDGMAPQWLVDRIVDHPDIPWPLKKQLLEPHFTESTLRRHYGAAAYRKRKG